MNTIRLTIEEIEEVIRWNEEVKMKEVYDKMPKWKKMLYKLLIKLGGIK